MAASVWRVAERASIKAKNAQGADLRPLPLGWASAGLLLLSLVFLVASSYNPVGTKEVGVETSFGKTAGHLSNGPHLTAPWVQVHEMDAAIQTDSFIDSNGIGNGCAGIPVRIANQQTGCASVSFQWRIRPAAVARYRRLWGESPTTSARTSTLRGAVEVRYPLSRVPDDLPPPGDGSTLSSE